MQGAACAAVRHSPAAGAEAQVEVVGSIEIIDAAVRTLEALRGCRGRARVAGRGRVAASARVVMRVENMLLPIDSFFGGIARRYQIDCCILWLCRQAWKRAWFLLLMKDLTRSRDKGSVVRDKVLFGATLNNNTKEGERKAAPQCDLTYHRGPK